ncbi:SGNH/GDSL hydrolase family protein [Chryseolinea sp. T2]|uniref:SGNH/GDSL hydrolase family protein n=1 Tax=Chryseolinea sp. T2 TaxID=3129255 RepID=UPI003076F0DE
MARISILVLTLLVCASFNRPVKWVALGDSITYLNDHADETGNRITKGYMTIISGRHPDIQFVNKGFNGWTSCGIANKIETLGLEPADVYTVFLGTNDWWQGKPIGEISDYKNNTGDGTINGSFRIIVNKFRSLNRKARIILITPLQRGDFVYINDMKNNAYGSYRDKNGQTLKQVAQAIEDIGAYEKLPVIDLYNDSGITLDNMVAFKRLKDPATAELRDYKYPDYVGVPFNPEADTYPYPPEAIDMTYDGLHPSDKGYQIIADMLEKVLVRR